MTGLGILGRGVTSTLQRLAPPPNAAPSNTVAPTIVGSPNVGQVLSVNIGSWLGYPTPVFTYQWKNGGVDIGGETNSTYTPVSGDLGDTITCTVTGTNGSGNSSATTAGVVIAAAFAAPVNTVAPTVTGAGAVGVTLSCSTGTWTGNPTPTYTYQWIKDGLIIATGSTYTVLEADVGTTILCRVTATNALGSAQADSNTRGPISPTGFIGLDFSYRENSMYFPLFFR